MRRNSRKGCIVLNSSDSLYVCRYSPNQSDEQIGRVHIAFCCQGIYGTGTSGKRVFGGLKKKKCYQWFGQIFSYINIISTTEYFVLSLLQELFSYLYDLINMQNGKYCDTPLIHCLVENVVSMPRTNMKSCIISLQHS